MPAKLFGFKIQDDGNDRSKKSVVSPVPENQEDSSDFYVSSGFYGQYVDIEGVYKSEYDLIKRYREMPLHPEVDGAIEDVINEQSFLIKTILQYRSIYRIYLRRIDSRTQLETSLDISKRF